ncbi:MAG: hypothetical protein LC687_07955 [Actinobacteria bacterium]|nr:hypothetical protein [Actinomycetota bacterium]
MDYDEGMLFVKDYPDCSSVDIANHFGITVAKAFTWCNEMIELGLMYKTAVQSRINPKMIYGYRVIPEFDEPEVDNWDGSMRSGECYKVLNRCSRVHGRSASMNHLKSMNEWREVHGVPPLDPSMVL